MKKLSLTFLFGIILSLCLSTVIYASEGDVTWEGTDIVFESTVQNGDTFELKFDLNMDSAVWQGLASAQIKLSYRSDIIQLNNLPQSAIDSTQNYVPVSGSLFSGLNISQIFYQPGTDNNSSVIIFADSGSSVSATLSSVFKVVNADLLKSNTPVAVNISYNKNDAYYLLPDNSDVKYTSATGTTTFDAAEFYVQYPVTFKNGDEPFSTVQKVKTNEYAKAPTETPQKTGYTFIGWNTDSTATSGNIDTYSITNDTVFYAIYKINSYSLTIKTVGDVSKYSEENINYNTPILVEDSEGNEIYNGYMPAKDLIVTLPESGIEKPSKTFDDWSVSKSSNKYIATASYVDTAVENSPLDLTDPSLDENTKTAIINEIKGKAPIDKIDTNGSYLSILRGNYENETSKELCYFVRVNGQPITTEQLNKISVQATLSSGFENIYTNYTNCITTDLTPIYGGVETINNLSYGKVKINVNNTFASGIVKITLIYDTIEASAQNYFIIIPGDTTIDGSVDSKDVVKVANYAISDSPSGGAANNYALELADLSKDDEIDSKDVISIARLALGDYNIAK